MLMVYRMISVVSCEVFYSWISMFDCGPNNVIYSTIEPLLYIFFAICMAEETGIINQ